MKEHFEQWLREQGGYIHPNIDLFHALIPDTSDHRGVFAKQPVKEGEQLLLVPVEATLHLENVTLA
jgi:hypothetical protein